MDNEIVILELEKPKEAHDVPYQRYLEEMYKRG